MGKRGPKPAPPEARKGRQRIEGTAKALEGPPECPPHVKADKVAAAKWAEVTGLLDELGTLSRSDGDLIAMYCEAYSRYLTCCENLKSVKDYWYTTSKGAKMMHPLISIRSTLSKDLARWAAELGLSPSARSRVAANRKDKPNPLTLFIAEGFDK